MGAIRCTVAERDVRFQVTYACRVGCGEDWGVGMGIRGVLCAVRESGGVVVRCVFCDLCGVVWAEK